MPFVTEHLHIPESEFSFTFSRSSGPGGQNVNKVSTRVTLWFDVEGSPSLSLEQKGLIKRKLTTRINKNGLLRVVSYRHRTQGANRVAAVEHFVALLHEAIRRERPRKKTRVPKAAKKRRLADKRHRGRVKRSRRGQLHEE